MLAVDNVSVFNIEGAVRGMRNPLNSWHLSDSGYGCCKSTDGKSFVLCKNCELYHEGLESPLCNLSCAYYQVGKDDMVLMKKLINSGTEHRKFLRQIFITIDITAPLYWWKEFDTYKVGTVANSCSTMHTITKKPFELSDFSSEHLIGCNHPEASNFIGIDPLETFQCVIDMLNDCRDLYMKCSGDPERKKLIWWQIIQLLPSSYNQKRTVTMDYENAMNIIKQRTGHKLDEWNTLILSLKDLPYIPELLS